MTGGVTGRAGGGQTGVLGDGLPGLPDLAAARPIGHDAGGIIYEAVDLRLERPVRVRVLNPLFDDEQRRRFDHESKVLGRLSAHPNVVTVYDAGFVGDRPYLVTEWMDGDDLAALVARRGSLPWQAASQLTLGLCAGLEHVHAAGALHGDLRPATVHLQGGSDGLLDAGGVAVPTPALAELGITALRPGNDDPAVARHLHRAPEAFEGVLDARTDLYSLTALLHTMIDGSAPFWRPGDESMEALRLRLAHDAPPPLDPDLVPAALVTFVTAGLSRDPLDRPQTAAEFARELGLILQGRTTGSIPSVLHGTAPPSPAAPTVPGAAALPAPPEPPAPPAPPSRLGTVTAPVGHPGPELPAGPGESSGPGIGDGPSPPAGYWDWSAAGDGTTVYPGFGEPGTATAAPSAGLDAPAWNGTPGAPAIVNHDTATGPAPALDLGADPSGDAPATPPGLRRSGTTQRPQAFLIAMIMVTIGLVGLIVAVAMSALGGDGQGENAPPLPDPDAPATVDASGAVTGDASTTTADLQAMPQDMAETTLITAAPQSTSETTVARVAVPDMRGSTVEAATRALSEAGFQVLVVGRVMSGGTPGTVAQQKPDPGDLVALPLTVTLYIPRVSNLPAMVGRSANAVCLELQALSLACRRVTEHHGQIPAGSVIATNPPEGAPFVEGSTVEITVSRGPVTTVAVPDVAGRTREEAQGALEAAGFATVAFANQPSGSVPAGRAIGTAPAAGTALATDQPVTVLLSSGPPATVQVPAVTGQSEGDARAQLAATGLNAAVEYRDLPAGDGAIGLVIEARPAPGAPVEAGSTVVLVVGRLDPAGGATTTAPGTTAADQSTSSSAPESMTPTTG